MTGIGLFQIMFILLTLLLLIIPLGKYMAAVYTGQPTYLDRLCGPVERIIYRLCQINEKDEMSWITYLILMLFINFLGLLFLYALQRLQLLHPFNPQRFSSIPPDLAFNTATSFVTNTNWQSYSGENTLSYFTQMLGLTAQNFISAATGMALLVALIRGITRYESTSLGNFWVDLVRGIIYILLPLSFVLAIGLTSQGVIQNFKPYERAKLIEPMSYIRPVINSDGNPLIDIHHQPVFEKATILEQTIPMGPVASQIAIKQLGTNGGGFFGANAAHPFENPTPTTNFLELLSILLIPMALCYTFGIMVADKRQGWALIITMSLIFLPLLFIALISEQTGSPNFTALGIEQQALADLFPGGNLEGKETRFGITNSVLWSAATTATSNGSVNSMLDSYTPLGGLAPLWLMHLGEVIFGGVGSGLYGMLMLVIIAVFVAGLMVGRTPEYLGKKIEPYEMKMAALAVLVMPLTVLIFTAISVVTPMGTASVFNPGTHGFTEVIYAFTSMANNNGSSLSGLRVNTPYYNLLGGLTILIGRYWIAIPVLALAGSLARKKQIPTSTGTLATHTPLFVTLLIFVTIVLGALSFFPALALGPIAEHFILWSHYVS